METLRFRPFAAGDEQAVLQLVDADHVAGQPRVTPAMLREALSGRSPIDGGLWAELTDLHVDVATAGAEIAGVVAYARRARDDAGVLLWLHGHERRAVITALVAHAVTVVGGHSRLVAFEMATALTAGLEALPRERRATTRSVLVELGFTEHDLWRYMTFDHAGTPLPAGAPDAWTPTSEYDGWRLVEERDGQPVGEVEISLPGPGIGAIWWLETDPAHRGRGLGRALLGRALDELARRGARSTVLYVDDDDPDPGSPRSRHAANRLYDAVGFVEVDRLLSFEAPGPVVRDRLTAGGGAGAG